MADYLSEEEQLDRLKNWWDKNGTSIIVGVVLVVGGLGGWRWYDSAKTQELQAASELYESYLVADADARSDLASKLQAEFGDTSYATFVLLLRAKEEADAEQLDEAIATLRQVADGGAHPLLRDIVRMRLARLLREQDDSEAALAVLAEVETQGYRIAVLELKGDIHLAAGDRALAHEAYAAAFAEVGEGDQRPILQFKVDDTAPPQETP